MTAYDGELRIYLDVNGDTTDSEITNWVARDSVRITGGRASVTEQPAPAIASFTVYAQTGENPVPLALNQRIRIMTFGTGETYGRCWYIGYVSDASVNVQRWSNGTGLVATTYTCTSILGVLNRYDVGATGYVKQYDGDRVAAIVDDCGENTFYIPTGATYEIAAYSNGATNALALAQEAANSAKGVLYEWCFLQSGHWYTSINYDTSTTRISNTIYELEQSDIAASNIALTATMTECATVVKATNAAGNGTTYQNTSAIAIYGRKYGERGTTLHNLTDANTLGQELLAAKSIPKYRISNITLNLGYDGLSTNAYNFRPIIGQHITFTVPDPLNDPDLIPVAFNGFVEGYAVSFPKNDVVIDLNLSNYGDIYPYTYWSTAETATTTWATAYTATTAWEDIT